MKNAVFTALILALMVVGGWWWLHPRDARQTNMAALENEATAALLHAIILETDAAQPKHYFVALGSAQTDPSRLFIARFAGHAPPVRGLSSATMVRNGQVQETTSGRMGVIIQVIQCKKIRPGTFDLLVRFPKQATGPNQFTYRLIQTGSDWAIKYRVPTH